MEQTSNTPPASRSALIYREPSSPDELLSLLRLRYEVYRASRLRKVAAVNGAGIDVDRYDVRSLHYGLFDAGKPVGYVRIVTESEQEWGETITPFLPSASEPDAPFPLMSYFPDREVLCNLCADFTRRGLTVVEAGRLSLAEEYRSIRIAADLVAPTFAAALVHGVDEAIVTCVPAQIRFYERFGFRRVPGTGTHCCPEVGVDLCCLLGSPFRLADERAENVSQLASSLRKIGKVRLAEPVAAATGGVAA